MIARLYRLELVKLSKRLSSFAVWLTHLVLLLFVYGSLAYTASRYPQASFRFPTAWPSIFENGATVSHIMTGALVVLVTGSELEWRVTRQNLIDGVRREEWLAVKILLLATLAMLFCGTQVVFAAVLAGFGTEPPLFQALELGAEQLRACVGLLLGTMLFGSMAFWFTVILRNTGAALALTLIYPVFDNILARVLRGYELDGIADLLLLQAMQALNTYDNYRESASALVAEPSHWQSLTLLFCVSSLWLLLLNGSAAWSFRARDI